MYINFHVHNFCTSEGHGHIRHYYNVLPEATFMFTGKQHCLQTNRHDQSLGVTDIYTPTKYYYLILLCFQDMSVESEEEEEEE